VARYPIRLGGASRIPLLVLFGVRASSAYAELDDAMLHARFGWWSMDIAVADIVRWEITGPYRWWRALGVRRTWSRRDTTFGGSAHGGVSVTPREPIRCRFLRWRVFPTTELFLTLDDLEGFAAELAARGITGEDRRTGSGSSRPQ
jgi:hypothetical protein